MIFIDLLSPYLPDSPNCLELFARNLWPGWTSWGNEVSQYSSLKLNVFVIFTEHLK